MLAVSLLPNAFRCELAGANPNCLLGARLGLLAVLVTLTFVWKGLRPLRRYLTRLLSNFADETTAGWWTTATFWQAWFGGAAAPFGVSMLGT